MKSPSRGWRALALVSILAAAPPAFAIDPFILDITIGSSEKIFGFHTLDEAIDALDQAELQRKFGGTAYDGSQTVSVNMNFRGFGVGAAFNTAGPGLGLCPFSATASASCTALTFQVSNNVAIDPADKDTNGKDTITFNGATRSESIQLFKDFLKKNKVALKAFLTALARFSPVDPLAGNPTSLFSKFQSRDFSTGFTHKVSQVWGCGTSAFNFSNDQPIQVAAVGGVSDIFAEANSRAAELQAENEIGMGLTFANMKAPTAAGDYTTNTVDLPLSYTVKFDSNPSHKLRFDLPITVSDTGGGKAYSAGFGLAYTYPATDMWTLTPAVGVGATGSTDLGSAGGVGAYSLTSAYTMRFGGFGLSLGDSVGQYKSIGLKFGDVEAQADINNTVFTNGLLFTGPSSMLASNLVMEYSVTDTRITGDTVYSKYYDEIGVGLGHIGTEQGVITSYLKGGLSYVIGDHDIKMLKLTLASRF